MTCLSLAIILFFRKTFSFKKDSFQVIVLLLASKSYLSPHLVLLLFLMGSTLNTFLQFSGAFFHLGFVNVDLQDMLNLLLTIVFLTIQRIAIMTWRDGSDQEVEIMMAKGWVMVVLLSIFQVLRNPLSLKQRLRPLRVGLGPASILCSVIVGLLQAGSSNSLVLFRCLGLVMALCSFLAGFCFRPDNTEILNLVLGQNVPSLGKRIKIHGYLNITAVVVAIVKITLHEINNQF